MSDHDLPDGPDEATFSMFSDAETGPADGGYQVLARKFRPRRFDDLIGQEAMVRTLTNAFETDRIAHAFMLTGVRGVGKTTTARLLARALNYQTEDVDRPSITLDPPGEHCAAIMAGRHPDVMELDAASRTGVADMRDLLDGARYAPVSARYKVYVIDEVHMLSIAAFNALLKTLEEPPGHVKFIFATTEIRKVPVTVLSRCQRFDLKRLEGAALARHLGQVAEREGANISQDGLALIARAAEGSVRDGLSILDQAIVQTSPGEPVSAEAIRDMLGLGDRGRLMDVFDMAVHAKGKEALAEIDDQLLAGAEPLVLLKDLLDICAEVASAQVAGEDYASAAPGDQVVRTRALAQFLTAAQVSRDWQILLAGYRDTQTAPDSATALRMVILRLVAAAGLPSPEEAARMIAQGAASGGPTTGEAPGDGSGPTGFDEVADRLRARRELLLLGEMETYIRPASASPGRLACALADGAPDGLLRRLASFLEEDTGHAWEISQVDTSAETMRDRAERIRREKIDAVRSHPEVQSALAALPGAEIVDVRQEGPVDRNANKGNVVEMRARRTSS